MIKVVLKIVLLSSLFIIISGCKWPIPETDPTDPPNNKPVASAIVFYDADSVPVDYITGAAPYWLFNTGGGTELLAVYEFNDPDGDTEGSSGYRWLWRPSGVNPPFDDLVELTGETNVSIIEPTQNIVLFVEVTPYDVHGMSGDPVLSEPVVTYN